MAKPRPHKTGAFTSTPTRSGNQERAGYRRILKSICLSTHRHTAPKVYPIAITYPPPGRRACGDTRVTKWPRYFCNLPIAATTIGRGSSFSAYSVPRETTAHVLSSKRITTKIRVRNKELPGSLVRGTCRRQPFLWTTIVLGGGGHHLVRGSVQPIAEKVRDALAKGYSGDACGTCARFALVRNGTCLTCDSCGSTSGCS